MGIFGNIRSAIENRIANNTRTFAQKVVDEARANAPTPNIASAIRIENVERDGRTVEATIVVDLNIAPEGAAYEYGSGIHSTEGKKYPITAVNQPAMVFYWEPPYGDWGSLQWKWKYPDRDAGEVVFHRPRVVMHPGVAAKPYMTPALRRFLPELWATSNGIIQQEIEFYFKELTEQS